MTNQNQRSAHVVLVLLVFAIGSTQAFGMLPESITNAGASILERIQGLAQSFFQIFQLRSSTTPRNTATRTGTRSAEATTVSPAGQTTQQTQPRQRAVSSQQRQPQRRQQPTQETLPQPLQQVQSMPASGLNFEQVPQQQDFASFQNQQQAQWQNFPSFQQLPQPQQQQQNFGTLQQFPQSQQLQQNFGTFQQMPPTEQQIFAAFQQVALAQQQNQQQNFGTLQQLPQPQAQQQQLPNLVSFTTQKPAQQQQQQLQQKQQQQKQNFNANLQLSTNNSAAARASPQSRNNELGDYDDVDEEVKYQLKRLNGILV